MAFLHCHNCGWSQDDFWDKDAWNPVESIQSWKDYLFKDNIDRSFTDDPNFIMENGNISVREVVAREFERCAKNIRNMVYRTMDEFKKLNPGKMCPVCNQKSLDID